VGETLSIRLTKSDRAILESAASERGIGVSTLVRGLAHEEARRLRTAKIRAEGEAVVSYLREHAEAVAELEMLGTPLGAVDD
jgi:hypothetical protein